MTTKRLLSTLLIAVLCGCQGSSASISDMAGDLAGGRDMDPARADLTGNPGLTSVPTGEWGEQGKADMMVTAAGATVDLPCGSGTISTPLSYDARGNFAADGTYTSGGIVHNPVPARFTGMVQGSMMSLTITIGSTGNVVGTWALTYMLKTTFARCL